MRQCLVLGVSDLIDLYVKYIAGMFEPECIARPLQPQGIPVARKIANVCPARAAVECTHGIASHDFDGAKWTQGDALWPLRGRELDWSLAEGIRDAKCMQHLGNAE